VTAGTQPLRHIRVLEHLPDPSFERFRVLGWNQYAGLAVPDDLGYPADTGRHNGLRLSHRLDENDAKSLLERREHGQVDESDDVWDVTAGAEKQDVLPDPQLHHPCF